MAGFYLVMLGVSLFLVIKFEGMWAGEFHNIEMKLRLSLKGEFVYLRFEY